jgi:putative acetyltransferase
VFKIRKSRPTDGERLVSIWRSAVDATHDFLDPADRAEIDVAVQSFLPQSDVWLAVDSLDFGIGFMGMGATPGQIESLFIDASFRGIGVGRQLIEFARATSAELTTQVNEQNEQALGFYLHLGFAIESRSPTDECGRPYPLLHMRLARP